MVNQVTKSKLKTIFHYFLIFIAVISFILCVVQLTPLGYERIIGFKEEGVNWNNYISNLYSFVVTVTVALVVYLIIDDRTSKKIDEIKEIEKSIREKTEQISKITTRVRSNVNKMEENIQKISTIQDQIAFETEKNRLINSPTILSLFLSEVSISFFKYNMNMIFHEKKCDLSIIEDKNKTEPVCSFIFIKESNKRHALPKIFYLFDKTHETPYFCVQALEGNKTVGIQQGEYYYLSYDFDLPNEQIVWYLGKKAPMFKDSPDRKFKVSFSSMSGDGGIIPSANNFCKDC